MRSRVLNVMRHLTRSQCSSKSMGVTWSRFDRISITRAQAFWMLCSLSTTATDSPFRRLFQQSIRDITRACTSCFVCVLVLESDKCVQCCGDGSMLFWKCLNCYVSLKGHIAIECHSQISGMRVGCHVGVTDS